MQVEGQIHGKRHGGITLPVLVIALSAIAVLFVVAVWVIAGPMACVTALSAVAVCLAGVIAGWAISTVLPREHVLGRLAIAMMTRMFVPLCGLLVLFLTSPTLVASGLAFYTIVIYLCLLAAETYWTVRQVDSWASTEGAG